MSDVFRKRLREGSRELNGLYHDVYPAVTFRQDWRGQMFARRSLGDSVEVETWYLGEYFLLTWNDWHGLLDRYPRYFGLPQDALPARWHQLDRGCQALAARMLRDKNLDEILSKSWTPPRDAPLFTLQDGDLLPDTVFHEVITNHRRLSLLAEAPPDPTIALEEGTQVNPAIRALPHAYDVAQSLNSTLMRLWDQLSRRVRDDALWYLRNYRHATLHLSWLTDGNLLGTQRLASAFLYALAKEKTVSPPLQRRGRRIVVSEPESPSAPTPQTPQVAKDKPLSTALEQFVGELNVDYDERQKVSSVLHRITQAVSEIGYDNFVEDVTSGNFFGGRESPVGSDAINLIPSKHVGTCCTILLAVSKGVDKKAAVGFPKIMMRVKTHLIDCTDKTRVVIVLCDNWFPTILDDHLDELRAHNRRGVQFLFLMAGTPGRVVAPVAADFAVAP